MPNLEDKLQGGDSSSMKNESKGLWSGKDEGQRFDEFVESTAGTHKVIFYGESGTGKTRAYLKILELLKEQGIPPEDVLMEIVYPDRATGITKLSGIVPMEYVPRMNIHAISTYEELIKATSTACKNLEEHYEKTGRHGWLVTELLGEIWAFAQDYYTRQSYGEGLGDFFAEKQQVTSAIKEDKTAYSALEGWKDWTVIKHFHNFNYIDKLKKKQFNIVFTAEVKQEGRDDSIFYEHGRPSGEKDNMHRVDEIIKLQKSNGNYYMRPYKLTGYKKLYPKQNITGKNPFKQHIKALKQLEKKGLRESSSDKIESIIQKNMDVEEDEEIEVVSDEEESEDENKSTIDEIKNMDGDDEENTESVSDNMNDDDENDDESDGDENDESSDSTDDFFG